MASTTAEKPQSQPTASSAAARPPVEIHSTAHLDPGAYVRGTHAIFLGPGVLIHPRAMLVSVYGPLIINDNTVIMEKCIIGGPVPDAKEASSTGAALDVESDPIKTVIGTNVLVMAHAQIHAGATLHDSSTVESYAMISKNANIGKHSKVCPGAIVADDVGEWDVVFGGINQRRKRMPLEEVEQARLKAMQKDREATITVLRTSARAPVLRKK
jgi:carbonic anhydrase/acetyltransferase-like protein (isoleucine patch superfamily)